MVYWPGVDAPSKKDVSGSEYITRTRMMQGVFVGIRRLRNGAMPPQLDKSNTDGLLATGVSATMVEKKKHSIMVLSARMAGLSAGGREMTQCVKRYWEVRNEEACFEP
jgi:hypothetical protein